MRKFYVILFTAIFIFVANNFSYGQLTGTKTIPGDYATIAAAVTDLNAQGVGASGQVNTIKSDIVTTIDNYDTITITTYSCA